MNYSKEKNDSQTFLHQITLKKLPNGEKQKKRFCKWLFVFVENDL